MSPPSTTVDSSRRRHHERRDQQVRTDAMVRFAQTLLDEVRVYKSPSWVSRTVRGYMRHGVGRCTFGSWLTDRIDLTAIQRERAEVLYILEYADPTGETAVRNVMRAQGHDRGGRS